MGLRLGVKFDGEHAHRNDQAEQIHGVEPREACQPELAYLHLASGRAIGVVVGEDEARKQQEEADRGVAVVYDRREPAKVLGIAEMEEDEIERREDAQSA